MSAYNSTTRPPAARSRHYTAPERQQKKTILLFGSFTLSGIKPHQLSKTESAINKSHEYRYPHQPASFSSVLNSVRTFSSSQHVKPSNVSKIFIAIDYKPPDKAGTASNSSQKERFLEAFCLLVSVINADLYPEAILIFQSILPKSGFLSEIKERNRWFKEAVETFHGARCKFMDCSTDFLTHRGDFKSNLYNNGPEASLKDKARLLNEEGMEVLIKRYQTFLKLNYDRSVSSESPINQMPLSYDRNQDSATDFEEPTPNLYDPREKYLSDSPAVPIVELGFLIEEMSKATAEIIEISNLVTNKRVQALEEHFAKSLNDDEGGRKVLESCAETLANAGLAHMERKFEEFYKADVIEPMLTSQNDLIKKLASIKFNCDVTTDFDSIVEDFRRQIQTECLQSVANLATNNDGTFRKVNQQVYYIRRKAEDALQQNERELIELTKIVNFSDDEEAVAHLEKMDTVLTKLEEIFN